MNLNLYLKRASEKEDRARSHGKERVKAFRKSDWIIVAMKAGKAARAKGPGYSSDNKLNNFKEDDLTWMFT